MNSVSVPANLCSICYTFSVLKFGITCIDWSVWFEANIVAKWGACLIRACSISKWRKYDLAKNWVLSSRNDSYCSFPNSPSTRHLPKIF